MIGWKTVSVPGLAALAVAVAFSGGALSGWVEQGPSGNAGPLPPATASSSTTSTTSAAADAAAELKAQVVVDLSTDLTSQRLDSDLARRRAIATSPEAVAMRHQLIAEAWAPDQVARVEALYDAAVLRNASNPTVPSVTDATFEPTAWQSVSITGISATVVVVGHFRIHEPGNRAAASQGGYVTVFDRTWTVAVTFSNGKWLMEGRSAA